jgi:hypothetical protein
MSSSSGKSDAVTPRTSASASSSNAAAPSAAASAPSLGAPASASPKLDSIDLLAIDFISSRKYSQDKLSQVMRDWVAFQDQIFLQGISLREIVDKLKIENLKQQLIEYRDSELGNKADRLDLLKQLCITLNNKFELYLANPADSMNPTVVRTREKILAAYENTFNDGEEINFQNPDTLNKAIPFLFVGLTGDDILYDLSKLNELQEHPAYDSLARLLREVGMFFKKEEQESSEAILIDIWRKHLLAGLPEIAQSAYIEQLSQFGHQGGLLLPSLTQHQEYLSFIPSEEGMPPYMMNSDECGLGSKISFVFMNNILRVDSESPIKRLANNAEGTYIANKDGSPIITTTTTHLISLKADSSGAIVELKSAVDAVQNQEAMRIIMGAFEDQKKMLLDYANHYLEHGHDRDDVNTIMDRYPNIQHRVPPIKTLTYIQSLGKDQAMHQEGDRILHFIGMSFPKYADDIMTNITSYPQEKFVRAIKLLRRMGRSDLAATVVLPYALSLRPAEEDNGMSATRQHAIDAVVNDQSAIKAAYTYLNQYGFLSRAHSALPPHKETLLLDYAREYLVNGHNPIKVNKLLDIYPDIKEMVPVKERTLIDRVINLGSSEYKKEGDKILLYIGNHLPKYAKSILEQTKSYDRNTFVKAIKMLRRMGKLDLAIEAVMPAVKLQNQTKNWSEDEFKTQAKTIVEDESKIYATYDYMAENKLVQAAITNSSPPAQRGAGGPR